MGTTSARGDQVVAQVVVDAGFAARWSIVSRGVGRYTAHREASSSSSDDDLVELWLERADDGDGADSDSDSDSDSDPDSDPDPDSDSDSDSDSDPDPDSDPDVVDFALCREALQQVAEAVRAMTRQMDFSREAAEGIELSIHEAVVNAIKHGGGAAADCRIDISLARESGGQELIATVRDRGAGFDPAAVPSPLDDDRLLVTSGRGLLYMRTFMDRVEFSAHPGGGTMVRMTKRKSPSG